ncbi:MAG TPA: hypothetical protein VJB89_00580 [Candidatus Nanoarchaeia archaeon]|nr:hypothetical protein [Candidatus Nanoarchaeia archaeon]
MWVVISGINGTGKTSLKEKLEIYFGEKGYTIINFKVPFHNWVTEMITLSGEGKSHGDPYTDELIFAASHRLESGMIKKWRAKYDILISKRFWGDQIPYAEVKGVPSRLIRTLTRYSELEKPDMIFFLDCEAEVALSRSKRKSKYEYLEFMQPLRVNYLRFIDELKDSKIPELKDTPYYLIDACKSLDLVYEEIRDIIEAYILENNIKPKIKEKEI